MPLHEQPLVGRELDLAVALDQLKRVEGGAPASLLVRGEAGIGKTRLVSELLVRARQLGYTVVLGRADDLDRGIPYAVFRDVIARLEFDPERRPELAQLAAQFREALDGEASGGVEDEGRLAAVFAIGVRLIRELGQGPTVLVLEDLHLADRESLALVAVIARLSDIPLLTVVTLRPNVGRSSDVERLIDRMGADALGATIDLEPLDRHETQALVATVLSAAPDDTLAEAVFTASQGNPFFACEVVQSFTDGGAIRVEDGRAHLVSDTPALGLRPSTALLRRLFGGTSEDVELAKVVAMFGRFPLRHLALVQRLTGRSSDEVAQSFDRLVKAGLVVRTEGEGYGFIHAIVRDTLYDDIGPAERRRIHAAIAGELAKDRRAGIVLDIVELATHVAESAEPGDTAAAEVLLEAGRVVAATAPLVSADYHRRAIALLPLSSPLRVDALAMQARALHIGCRASEAAVVGRRALEALPAGSVRASTVSFVVNDLYVGGRTPEALEVIDAELAQSGPPCPLLAQKVNLLFQVGRRREAADLFPAALAATEAPGSQYAAAQLMALTHLIQYANHVSEVTIAADLLARLTTLTDTPALTVRVAVQELLAFADWRPGLIERTEHHLAAARILRPDAAALNIGGAFEIAQTRLLWMRGRWDEVLALIRTASVDLEQRGVLVPAQLLLCVACEVLVDRGDLDEAAGVANRFVTPIETLTRNSALARARLRHAVGDRAGAYDLLTLERERAAGGGSVWKLAEVLRELVDVLIADQRTAEARDVATELEFVAGRTGWPECRVPALRARAIVDRDVDAARAYAELAKTEHWEVQQAHAALVLGELNDDPGQNLTLAYQLFDSYGATPLRRRAAAGLRARGRTVPRRRVAAHSVLTETEEQLIRLVVGGYSNREIATALHYSTKTIEVYLSRVYAKTGCASRLELIRGVDTGAVLGDS